MFIYLCVAIGIYSLYIYHITNRKIKYKNITLLLNTYRVIKAVAISCCIKIIVRNNLDYKLFINKDKESEIAWLEYMLAIRSLIHFSLFSLFIVFSVYHPYTLIQFSYE